MTIIDCSIWDVPSSIETVIVYEPEAGGSMIKFPPEYVAHEGDIVTINSEEGVSISVKENGIVSANPTSTNTEIGNNSISGESSIGVMINSTLSVQVFPLSSDTSLNSAFWGGFLDLKSKILKIIVKTLT